jgi:hypothetical protein
MTISAACIPPCAGLLLSKLAFPITYGLAENCSLWRKFSRLSFVNAPYWGRSIPIRPSRSQSLCLPSATKEGCFHGRCSHGKFPSLPALPRACTSRNLRYGRDRTGCPRGVLRLPSRFSEDRGCSLVLRNLGHDCSLRPALSESASSVHSLAFAI